AGAPSFHPDSRTVATVAVDTPWVSARGPRRSAHSGLSGAPTTSLPTKGTVPISPVPTSSAPAPASPRQPISVEASPPPLVNPNASVPLCPICLEEFSGVPDATGSVTCPQGHSFTHSVSFTRLSPREAAPLPSAAPRSPERTYVANEGRRA